MDRKQEYDWLNDPFDERKEAEDILNAQKSRNRGCLLAFLVIAILVALLLFGGCSLIASLGSIGI